MILYIELFFELLKIGLFSVGGGLATLPFFYDLSNKYNWFSKSQLIDMVAISESTPGPIGINMSTYVGFETSGILGGLLATFALVLPSFIIIITIANFMNKFRNNKYINMCFYVIKPAVVSLILISCIEIYKITLLNSKYSSISNIINYTNLILFIIILTLIMKYKKHPIFYILLGGIIGLILKL